MEQVRSTFSRAAGPVTLIGTVGGFVGDVLAPLGAFAQWMVALSLVCLVLSGVFFFRVKRVPGRNVWESPVPVALFISFSSFIIFSFWSVVFAAGPENGYLAENIEPVAQLQAQLFNIEQDVAEIKETTEQTAEEVEEIGETTSDTATQVVVAATAQAQGFADIQDAFADLQSNQVIIESPGTPQEWYSNARLYQLKGDTANAITAYEGYFDFGLEYVDPYLQYTALLKATEGVTRARQLIEARLNENPDSLTLDLIAAQLLDDPQARIERYRLLTQRDATYAPAWNELAKEYGQQAMGRATRDNLVNEAEANTKLIELEGQQLLSQYYIDKALAVADVARAEQRLATTARSLEFMAEPTVTILQDADGFMFLLGIMDASRVFIGMDNPDPQQDTGTTQSTIGPLANTNNIGPFMLEPGEHTFYYRYIDINGAESPVFSKTFQVYPITYTINQLPPDLSTNTISVSFGVEVLGAISSDSYTYQAGLSPDKLELTGNGIPFTAFTLPGLTPGDYTFYIQATNDATGEQTEVVAIPFTVN